MPSSFSGFITMPQDLLEVNEADIRLLEEIDRCLANAKPIIKLQMEQMDTEIFDGCFKVAQKYHIDIDEGRLVQALTDAEAFYCEGYEAGKRDAESVRHGRWDHIGGDEWCCTNCGEVISTDGSWDKPTYKHCHECGAKMEGGETE